MEKVKKWLEDNVGDYGSDFGYGSGNGTGDVDGSGDGSGYGYGSGNGDGSGDGSSSGYSIGAGSGAGDGSGSGDSSGSGSGSGYGSGSGSGIGSFDGKVIFDVDGIQTIITKVKDAVAKGFILNSDFTTTPCFVVKGHGYFAHGQSLEDATYALREKIFGNMDSEEAIKAFMRQFKKGEKYPGTDFFEWHHYLTGSCLMGRESFVRNKGLNLEDAYTVEEFIAICENDYGSKVIKKLKEAWQKQGVDNSSGLSKLSSF